jgi:hypothetical protein
MFIDASWDGPCNGKYKCLCDCYDHDDSVQRVSALMAAPSAEETRAVAKTITLAPSASPGGEYTTHENIFLSLLIIVIVISLIALLVTIVSLIRYRHRKRLALAIRKQEGQAGGGFVSLPNAREFVYPAGKWRAPLPAKVAQVWSQGE